MPKVLVTDDNAYMRKAMSRLLIQRGHIVHSACDGREAAKKIIYAQKNNTPYNLLITDILMPNIDGFKLVDMIRQNAKSIEIIAITGGSDTHSPESLIKQVEPYVTDVLVKPFKHDAFIMSVDQTMKKHWARRAKELSD
jgi:CheY-like chemotaxis protein